MHTFECHHRYSNGHFSIWTGSWQKLSPCADIHELRIKGRGSSYDIIVGYCSSGNYLCIPSIDVGCALASWSDVLWNIQRLSQVINETDAVTIATALLDYGLCD